MTFRARLLAGFAIATALPLAMLGLGVRRQIDARLSAQHAERVDALARVAMQDLLRERTFVDGRLRSLANSIVSDNRVRVAVVGGSGADRGYLLDWAGDAMRLTGLSMLQLQDEQGRIVSSGHFRNEFDRLDAALPRLLADAGDSVTLVSARTADGRFLALARVDSLRLAGRPFTLVGGVVVDSASLARFARDPELAVAVITPDGSLITDTAAFDGTNRWTDAARRPLLYIDSRTADSARVVPARLIIRESRAGLAALERDVNRWFLGALFVAIAIALSLAAWLSASLSRPVAELARATSAIDLEGPDVQLAAARDDELGALARRFAAMTRRLRASAVRLRDAERRATVGEMARQVNHDIKNGLIPIRNVMRHLTEVQEQRPAELPAVFGERRATLESSIGYLDTLARNYAKLTLPTDRRTFDANTILREIASAAGTGDGVMVETRLADELPPILGDPLVFRRIVDNVLRNALESLPPTGGRVCLVTTHISARSVRVEITDTGRGMSEQELARAFDDFFTTKQQGTGLGLSVVRRLTADLHGSLRVTSEPGRGTTFTLDFPTGNGERAPSRDSRFAPTRSTPERVPDE